MPKPFKQAEYNTRSISNLGLTGLNLVFSDNYKCLYKRSLETY